jgi:hypothetical protein
MRKTNDEGHYLNEKNLNLFQTDPTNKIKNATLPHDRLLRH